MNYNWNWKIFFEISADGRHTWLTTLFIGLGWTLTTALCAGIIAFLLGSALGVMRTTPSKWLVKLGNAYVEFFRNIPLLVQLFLWYFVLPELLPNAIGSWIKSMTPPWASFVPAVIGLGLFTAARVSEQVRAGIQALSRGQGQAGTALGLTLSQRYRFVLLPMAYRIILPPLTSETMNLIKNTSV
ncbi:MAG TPA: amino acid ABC transporter permease, partial [Casimicrobiaceae bacterium]|nr:amino acid ABC transporter permease [Casimicrobiaceae bacterium]